MRNKIQLVVVTVVFGVFVAGCPEGGPDLDNNNNTPPQRDSSVDVEVELCGNGVCDEAEGEDCDTCASDCLGVACSAVQHITVDDYRPGMWHETGNTVIDMRPYDDCIAGHLPGDTFCSVISDWWDGTEVTDGGSFLDWAKASYHNPIVFYGTAADADEVLAVGEAAFDLGFDNIYMIDGGVEAWDAKGWFKDISYEAIDSLYYPPTGDVFLVDTMDATSYEDCHIQDATHLDAGDLYYGGTLIDNGQILLDMAPSLTDSVLIFFCVNSACTASEDASIAAELLGYTTILHYKGGTEDWIDNGGGSVGAGCTP